MINRQLLMLTLELNNLLSFFKKQFDFDDKKYEKRVNANRQNAGKNKKIN